MDVDLTDLDRFANGFPHDVFTMLRRERPVWFHPPTAHTPGGEGFWVLTRHADIVAAATDAATFSSHTGGVRDGGGTLIEDLPSGFAAGVLLNMMDDPRHRLIRRLVSPAVSPRMMRELEEDLRQRTAAILDAVVARPSCDFLVEVAAELPLQAIAKLLGVPQADRHELFAWANATLDYDDRDLGALSEKSAAAGAAMFAYGSRLIEEKRRAPGDDLLSAVVHGTLAASDGSAEPMSDLELQMFFNLLVHAGSETTRNSLALGVLALIERPAAWQRLRAEPALLPLAVEEILRWASSTPYNRRTATRDVVMGGETIRAGDKVTLWWASANRDDVVFESPFELDVGRAPNPHLAFGHGAHFCLGAALARLEIRVVLEALLGRCRMIESAGPVEWTRSNKHTGLRHMPVALRS
ncbi:MAG TPA: cytochrome P450 [Candidatus Dormibacteraeota bacterium]|nr:cytochrome P450 [Candidatus Dormibacteraeota bacterium]